MQQKHVNQAIAYLDQYKSPWCSPKKVVTTGSNSTSPFHWARGQAVGAGQNVRFVVAAIQPGPLQGVNMKSYIHIISFHVIRYHFISWHVISYDIHNHTNIYIYTTYCGWLRNPATPWTVKTRYQWWDKPPKKWCTSLENLRYNHGQSARYPAQKRIWAGELVDNPIPKDYLGLSYPISIH